MKTEDKILKAKIRLVLQSPFFATLALGMTYKQDDSIKTASCDGSTIRYNSQFVDGLSMDELTTLLAHVSLHPGLLHHLRQGARDHGLYNRACDYAINPLLKDSGFKLPEDALISSEFTNMSAEDIYTVLQEREQKKQDGNNQQNQPGQQQPGQGQPQSQPGNDPGQWGQVEKPANLTQENKDEKESQAKQKLVQAMNAAKQAGTMPGMIEALINELIQPRVNWKEVLERFIAEIAHNDYTWTKPNPRYIASGLYLPALENLEVGKVVFAVDTSGSINKDLLDIFVSELRDAAQMFSFPVTVLFCDTDIQGDPVELDPEDNSPLTVPRGGGTDFRPPFIYVNQNIDDVKALLYFTDGDCKKFPQEPDYPTLWAVYSKKEFTPPFGEVIKID